MFIARLQRVREAYEGRVLQMVPEALRTLQKAPAVPIEPISPADPDEAPF